LHNVAIGKENAGQIRRVDMQKQDDEMMLDQLQRATFKYFEGEVNPANGLITDSTKEDVTCSVAAVGLALTAYTVAAERGFMPREAAIARTLATLRFFWNSPQNDQPDATGYQGFYYHFLDMQTGKRLKQTELSTIDTAIFLAGALAAGAYFTGATPEETEIRDLADQLYRRADWAWALNNGPTVSLGWTPETGLYGYRWKGYNEALLLYILGLGSPTHPLPTESYQEYTAGYQLYWRQVYGHEMLYAGALFIHQLPQIWLDLRDLQDEFMHAKQWDYFKNSQLATRIQQEYAIRNPLEFNLYNMVCRFWGVAAAPVWPANAATPPW
jgi:hypothetical protein